jgi:regulator of extracellular matrix RemA (YlzA/DUF370 family)
MAFLGNYLHIGTNTYIRADRVIGIFHIAVFHENAAWRERLTSGQSISSNVKPEEAKAVILTDTNELHLSAVSCRTLTQRWNALSVE